MINIDEIPSIAEHLRGIFLQKLNDNELKEPFKNIEKIDVDIILIRFPSLADDLSGFHQKIDEYHCIYINSSHTLGRQYTSFWHEYYHVIDDIEDDDTEKKATYFASCFIIPENELKIKIAEIQKIWNMLEIEDMIKIQYYFRTSLQNLIIRMNEIYKTKHFFRFQKYSSIDQISSYHEIVLRLDFPLDLIIPTNDFCFPKNFLDDIYKNVENDLISLEKANSLINMFKIKGVTFKW